MSVAQPDRDPAPISIYYRSRTARGSLPQEVYLLLTCTSCLYPIRIRYSDIVDYFYGDIDEGEAHLTLRVFTTGPPQVTRDDICVMTATEMRYMRGIPIYMGLVDFRSTAYA